MNGEGGLNRTLNRLVEFRRELDTCLTEMRAARTELEEIRDRLDGVWQDSFRGEFDTRHDELDEPVKALVDRVGERHLEFLDQQIRATRRYLNG